MPLGVEASINLDAFDPEDLDDEELNEGADVLSAASVASSAFYCTSQPAEGRKRRAGSESPPRLAPSFRSGLFSGDGIVAAGRKGVFNWVAEARAAAAKASRVRAGRVCGDRLPSTDGSTASGSVAHMAPKPSTALVRKLILVYRT